MKILIVDDSPIMRGFLREIFEGLGHQIAAEAETVAGALEAFSSCAPDLVALDVSLVDGDGLSVLKMIRQKDGAAKVVMISANVQKKIREEALAAGACGFLSKPFEMREVAELLQRAQGG